MRLRTVALCALCWMMYSVLAQDCPSGGTCSSGGGGNNGTLTHRVVSTVEGADAIDLCLVVSAASSMADRHRWLQSVVPLLEEELRGVAIGTDMPNRYCLVQFGGRGRYLTAVFLTVDGHVFFPATDFVHARRQLQKRGDVADGYEAIEFTVNNAPFRVNPRVTKLLVLVTDMGRSILASHTNLTRERLLSETAAHKVTLNTVVSASFTAGGGASVLGLHGNQKASVLSVGGDGFSLVEGPQVHYTSSAGGTVQDYITLALEGDGSSWPIDLVSHGNLTMLTTFVRAFVAQNGIQKSRTVEVCEQCGCVQVGDGGCVRRECVRGVDQVECRCLSTRPPAECVSPSPVSELELLSTLSPQPTQTPRPLVITGTVDQYPGGEVELTFHSTINRATYECVLITNDTDTPTLHFCSSPYYLKGVPPGQHQLLVVGRRRYSVGTRLFDFVIAPSTDAPTPTLTLHTVVVGNSSVRVEIRLDGFTGEVDLLCSVGSGSFQQCGSSRLLTANELGKDGVLFVVIAICNRGVLSAASVRVDKPTPTPTGNVKIQIVGVDLPDPFGRIRIRFNTSRNDVTCLCRLNTTTDRVDCQNKEYLADPRVVGAGTHTLSISCMDPGPYVDTQVVKFVLILPPTPPPGPLSCDVHVRQATEEQRLLVSYTCDRRVMATCQVSSLPLHSCNSPSGIYEADISLLGAGPHVFILSVDDGFGKTLMKVIPFTVTAVTQTARHKCCPLIESNSTLTPTTTSHRYEVQLDVRVAPGNCSVSDGFSYSINWGDGARESGMLQTLSSIQSSRQYETGESYVVEVNFCSSRLVEENSCCDTAQLSVNLH